MSFVRQSASIRDVGPHRSTAPRRARLSLLIEISTAHLLSSIPEGLPILHTLSYMLIQPMTARLLNLLKYGALSPRAMPLKNPMAKKHMTHSRCPSPSVITEDSPASVDLTTLFTR